MPLVVLSAILSDALGAQAGAPDPLPITKHKAVFSVPDTGSLCGATVTGHGVDEHLNPGNSSSAVDIDCTVESGTHYQITAGPSARGSKLFPLNTGDLSLSLECSLDGDTPTAVLDASELACAEPKEPMLQLEATSRAGDYTLGFSEYPRPHIKLFTLASLGGDGIVYYDNDDDVPNTPARDLQELIDVLVKLLSDNKDLEILAVGHASWPESRAYNNGLTKRRARNFRARVVKAKPTLAAHIGCMYFGEDRPAVPHDQGKEAEKKNRRVEIYIVTKAERKRLFDKLPSCTEDETP